MIQKYTTEDTIEEIHRFRREIADRFSGDLAAIAADAARRQAESDRPVWRPGATNKAMHPSGGGTLSNSGKSDSAAG